MFKVLLFFAFIISAFSSSSYYIKELDCEWKKCSSVIIKIKQWSDDTFKKLNLVPKDIILYPFGGGDVVFPISFFSDFKVLVLIGLEPVGEKFSLKNKDGIIYNMKFFFKNGFFVTKDMERFYKSGILTIILIQLEKLNAKNISYNIVDKNEVHFNFSINGVEKKIIYIKSNLNDENYENWKWIFDKYSEFTLYIKGASFVLQQVCFNKIKNELINRANFVLQDDTGFSFKYIKKINYKMVLFGFYAVNYDAIKGLEPYFQPDLKNAYLENKPELLPFAIGYRSHYLPSNLAIIYKDIDSEKID